MSHEIERADVHGEPATEIERRMIVGRGAMVPVHRRLCQVAPMDTTVLLLGESGTGKEMAAALLHERHPTRHRHRFVRVHCGAIPETLLESELFGHVKGAFTGADRDRAGVFEQADGGTLFLDEISTMTPQAQIRLLRVLQERQVTRLGSTESRPVDVRVVAASNEALKEMVEEGTFRQDLFYRLSIFPMEMPTLRDRAVDIPALIQEFSRRIADRMTVPVKQVPQETMDAFSAYTWPGNARELANAIEYAYVLAGSNDSLDRGDLPPEISSLPRTPRWNAASPLLTEEGTSLKAALDGLERDLILQSLELTHGNKAHAAGLLGLKRTTFLDRLRRLEYEGLIDAQPTRSSTPEPCDLAV
ncbi:MAG: sigma-54-dependent Fis family transcriptional regulator [bacterium]|nr:sigma-54-dependent Fis family transcriptional regulator [bacterium]